MQKTELIAQLAKEAELTQTKSAEVVNKLLDLVTEALKSGDKVTLTGFGTFEVRETAARVGTNPRTGAKLEIKASKRPAFSAGSLLRQAVSGKK